MRGSRVRANRPAGAMRAAVVVSLGTVVVLTCNSLEDASACSELYTLGFESAMTLR